MKSKPKSNAKENTPIITPPKSVEQWSIADMLQYTSIYPKRTDKISTIKEYIANAPWIKEALHYAYSPYIQFFVAEKSMPKAIREEGDPGTFLQLNEKSWRSVVKPLLDQLANRTLSNAEIRVKLGGLLAKLGIADQSALKRIILKDLNMGVAAKTINEAVGENLVHVPDTQLCNTFDPEKRYAVQTWWASRKMNGIRCRFKKFDNKWMLLTRKDHPVEGFSYLEGELLELCTKNHLSLIDGELFSTNVPFQTIASIVRGNAKISKEEKESIYLNVFCALKEGEEWPNTSAMTDWLFKMFSTTNWAQHFPHIAPVEYREISNTPETVDYWCREYTKEGYEGIVLRHPDHAWSPDRSDDLVKYKIFHETDLPIVEVKYGTPGKKWEDKVAALLCMGEVPAVQRRMFGMDIFKPVSLEEAEFMVPVKVEASCSTLTDEERETVTELADELPGMTCEVKFQSFTDKPNDEGYYSLAFPTFQKFKGI